MDPKEKRVLDKQTNRMVEMSFFCLNVNNINYNFEMGNVNIADQLYGIYW